MDPNSVETDSTPPRAASMRTPQMFNNARNNNFSNNTFVTNVKVAAGSRLDALHARVAPNAILNAGGRADPVRCHPGTRKEVIGRIEKWRTDAHGGSTDSRIFWLSGPAGAGKTAIVQTVAESWKSRDIHAANFFFFRSDASRNDAGSLVSTLLYQIFDLYPDARKAVENTLASRPRMLDAGIQDQFEQLICSSLRFIGPSLSQPIVLLIDGLDECDSEEEKNSQQQILHALDALVSQTDVPILVLVGSRDEHQIVMAFKELRSTIDAIFLDENYSPEKDIRLYVTAEFDRIKRTHRLAPQDEDWPSTWDVDNIVARSSGQFIYAATVMRFILQSPADPKLSLARVRGAARTPTKSPFVHLDAMYTYILSQAEDQEALKAILCAQAVCDAASDYIEIISPDKPLETMLRLYNDTFIDSDIHSCVAGITAVATLKEGKLRYHHSSMGDYLSNESRSGQYHVDLMDSMVKVLPGLWKLTGERRRTTDELHRSRKEKMDEFNRLANEAQEELRLIAQADEEGIRLLTQKIERVRQLTIIDDWKDLVVPSPGSFVEILMWQDTITPNFWSALLLLDPEVYDDVLPRFLERIYEKCISDDDIANYRRIIRKWIAYYVSRDDFSFLSEGWAQKGRYGQRYTLMAQIEKLHGDTTEEIDTLLPESAFDADEISSWVENLLWDIHGEYYPHRLETYTRLVGQWVFWAASNDVTLANIDSLP